MLERATGSLLCGVAKLLTGVRAVWLGEGPQARRRIYIANHRSHADFVLVWATLPPYLRRTTRPVAGSDYWLTSPLKRFLVERVFRAVLVDRTQPGRGGANPVEQMGEALAAEESLILFPEGTRNMGEGLLPFKSGLYHLLRAHPEAECVPVWIENLGRVMPKGAHIPVPLLCTLTFGEPLRLEEGESKQAFLDRTRTALLALAPAED